MEPLALVAAAAAAQAERVGIEPPGALAGIPPAPIDSDPSLATCDTPDAIGQLWEQLLTAGTKRAQGSHFTPPAIADRVAEIVFANVTNPEEARILDPTVGGGAFLLAAARWLDTHTTLSRGQIVDRLYGADIDAGAASVADAALELWAGGEARPHVGVIDSLLSTGPLWPELFDVVIGNPPFLSQLASVTSRDDSRSAELARRYGHAMGYADEAAIFLRRAIDLVGDRGVVGLVVPQSVLGAVAASPIRESIASRGHLTDLWIDGSQVFGAAVDVAATVIQRGDPGDTTRVHVGMEPTARIEATPTSASWAPLLAVSRQVPTVAVESAGTLGDRASVTAGFRQHFYGIADAVVEDTGQSLPRLLTAGAIDPLEITWGTKPIKFAGNRYNKPVLRVDAIADNAVRAWFTARLVPKVLVATQTRVVEVVADADGRHVPSVPVLVVEPHDPSSSEVWRITALLTTPLVSALLASKNAGTGLSADAIRIRAADLALVPLPLDSELWNQGAALAEQAQNESSPVRRRETLVALATVMSRAFGDESSALSWWQSRMRFPQDR
ncbi:MAG: hypothetical protein EX269_04170 [Acidimicrobiales bacterium]|nr:MAG: hypothetical protein EX269_04170 [Acidimicrobiales bacterium]